MPSRPTKRGSLRSLRTVHSLKNYLSDQTFKNKKNQNARYKAHAYNPNAGEMEA